MIKVIYPVPNDNDEVWQLFEPFVARFCKSWEDFPPGCECNLVPVLTKDDPTGKVSKYFKNLPVDYFGCYVGGGCDIGSAQWEAASSEPDDFIIALTSRVYMHRAGWVNHLAVARELYGKGLYGTSASMEGGILHLCTRCYAMDAEIWNLYPHIIISRDQGTMFEIGRDNTFGALCDWAEGALYTCVIVYWDGVRRRDHWLTPENIFRKGNQENLLVWDKHTDAWRDSDSPERDRLYRMAYGIKLPEA